MAFLISRQFILVIFFRVKFFFISKYTDINKLPLSDIHFFPYCPLPLTCISALIAVGKIKFFLIFLIATLLVLSIFLKFIFLNLINLIN